MHVMKVELPGQIEKGRIGQQGMMQNVFSDSRADTAVPVLQGWGRQAAARGGQLGIDSCNTFFFPFKQSLTTFTMLERMIQGES